MQLQEAINMVQAKLKAETEGQTEGDAADQYHDAYENYPVMMEVATHIVAQGIITQNYHAAMQRAQQEGGQEAVAPGQVVPPNAKPPMS